MVSKGDDIRRFVDLDRSPTAQDIGILLKMNGIWEQNVGPDHLSILA